MTTSACCGPGWAPPLPQVRQGDPPAVHRPDHRPDPLPPRGHPDPGAGPGDPGKKGEHTKVLENARKSGYVRCRVDGVPMSSPRTSPVEKNKKHSIEIVVDRLVIREDINRRLTDSVETAASPWGRPGAHQPGEGGPGPLLLPELRLRGLRHLHRGALPPDVLLQQPLRGLPHLHRTGQPDEGRPPSW